MNRVRMDKMITSCRQLLRGYYLGAVCLIALKTKFVVIILVLSVFFMRFFA